MSKVAGDITDCLVKMRDGDERAVDALTHRVYDALRARRRAGAYHI